jgi:flagellar basal-body rod protein FlgG
MTTIQGSISKLIDNSNVMFESLGCISSNIANYNTNCYKSQRFETYMNAGGSIQGVVRVDHSAGDLAVTFRELDVGIDGAGYIPITNHNGETAYTRGGSFAVNSEGYVVSNGGWLVGSGIKLPANYDRVKIKPDGTMMVLDSKESSFKEIGKIPLVVFKNPEGLEINEGNIVRPTEESGRPELVPDHLKIKQGKVEKANFDPYAFINETLKINGSIMSSSRFIRALDQIYRDSINLR